MCTPGTKCSPRKPYKFDKRCDKCKKTTTKSSEIEGSTTRLKELCINSESCVFPKEV